MSIVVAIQSVSCVWLFATQWTAACQAFQSFTISQSLLKLTSIEFVVPSNHLILCHPLLLPPSIFPSIRVFSNEWCPKYWSFGFSRPVGSQRVRHDLVTEQQQSLSFHQSQFLVSGGHRIGVSASASVLPMNIQDRSLGWTGWISLQSKGLSRVFSNTTIQKHQFFGAQLSL